MKTHAASGKIHQHCSTKCPAYAVGIPSSGKGKQKVFDKEARVDIVDATVKDLRQCLTEEKMEEFVDYTLKYAANTSPGYLQAKKCQMFLEQVKSGKEEYPLPAADIIDGAGGSGINQEEVEEGLAEVQDDGSTAMNVDDPAPEAHPQRRLRIVFIEEPMLRLDHNNVPEQKWPYDAEPGGVAHWISYELREGLFRVAKRHFPGHIFLSTDPEALQVRRDAEKELGAMMWDWMLLPLYVIQHQHDMFSVRFLRYSEFIDAILHPEEDKNEQVWRMLCTCDLVVGGVDFTDNYARKELLDADKGKVDQYRARMAILQRCTVVWPDPEETFLYGAKIPLIENLDKAAANVTKTPRPWTSCVSVGGAVGHNEIIKRGHSGWGNHVSPPSAGDSKTRWNSLVPDKDKAVEEQWFGRSWFRQQFIPTLVELGEMRCLFFAGKLTHITHTVKQKDSDRTDSDPVTTTVPLKHIPTILAAKRKDGHASLAYAWVNSESLAANFQDEGRKELETFANTTFNTLVDLEKSASPTGSSDLTLFARMDIGLIDDGAGGFQYFVNEVERSWGTTLFGFRDPLPLVQAMHGFGEGLARWTREKRARVLQTMVPPPSCVQA
ncbi:uncharacterized protein BXZ73DRAFT_108792 [Epithele typhae]|uniref:uncharacterized protein n=1 Tax=Epithele typhae TaxID=378194 RepID=UPI00200768B5|nr:uncharacterized protein BXZ73DRAFT_108792 [Epithele typhae]KAH9910588.1 hypothetical protein BXZ73DRAFT_108792 [Epithele typhae]